ncbi:hypothetical protein [Halorussus halophilus]|uniref:hypothetical protein n=1 Tax=Halorussus halophilus TaxID=2650975 RepID=UPI0013019364|nr:hypothetical protein [Halorussus halophilus]
MALSKLAKPLALYTGLFGAATVALAYVATHSGLLMLVLAGLGVLLVALGGAQAGAVSGAAIEQSGLSGETELGENIGLMPGPSSDTPVRALMLLYGLGLFVWSLVALLAFQSGLQ